MRWKSIKTVMIVILLGVNLWLIYLLVGRYMAQTYFGHDVLQNAVEILARDGIVLSAEQIDPKRRNADVYAAEKSVDYDDGVAAVFTASPINEVFPTPAGVRMIADNGDVISLNQGFGVSFLAGGEERETVTAIADWAVRAGDPLPPEQYALRGLREVLETRLNAETSGGAVVTVHAKLCFDAAYRFGEYTLFRCSQEIDGKKISGHTVDCLFDADGSLIWLDGTWGFLSLVRNYSAQLYDQINILFIEKTARAEQRLGDPDAVPGTLTLASMQMCYILNVADDAETGGSHVYYSPAWQIAYTDGTVRTYSAVTGEAVGTP